MKNKSKNEIILCAYNLPEMINVAKNLGLKIRYYDLNYTNGSPKIKDIQKKISKKTLAVVLTNMFNTYKDAEKIKRILKKNKIPLIEDNAIYYGNRAAAYIQLKMYKEALTDSNICKQIDPDYIKSYIRAGAAYFGLNEYRKSYDSYCNWIRDWN